MGRASSVIVSPIFVSRDFLDVGHYETDFAYRKLVNLLHFWSRDAHLFNFVSLSVGDQANLHAAFDRAIDHSVPAR